MWHIRSQYKRYRTWRDEYYEAEHEYYDAWELWAVAQRSDETRRTESWHLTSAIARLTLMLSWAIFRLCFSFCTWMDKRTCDCMCLWAWTVCTNWLLTILFQKDSAFCIFLQYCKSVLMSFWNSSPCNYYKVLPEAIRNFQLWFSQNSNFFVAFRGNKFLCYSVHVLNQKIYLLFIVLTRN